MGRAVDIKIVGLKAIRDRNERRRNPGNITQALHDRLSAVWATAASKFVKAAVTEVLVDTGMSAATFFPLARQVRRGSVAAVRAHIVSQNPSRPKKDLAEFPTGQRRDPPGERSRSEGDRLGEKAYRLNFGSKKRPLFAFSFNTQTFQFALHEEVHGALPEGEAAFRAYIQERFVQEASFVIRQWLRTGRPPRGAFRIAL